MKQFLIATLFSLFFAFFLSAQIKNKFSGIVGGDSAKVIADGADRIYIFPKMLLYNRYNQNKNGEELEVFFPYNGADLDIAKFQVSSLKSAALVFTATPRDSLYMFGVKSHYLFLEKRDGSYDKRIVIQDLKNQRKIIDSLYSVPIVLKKDGTFLYYKVTRTKKVIESLCPQSKNWFASGYKVLAAGQMKLSLSSGREYFTGKKICRIRS